jgi:serine/threonine protein kinase
LVRQSALLPDDVLTKRIANAAPPLPDEPREVAAVFVREGLVTTFQAQRLLWGQFRGFMLGNYKVLDQIGSGGMGSVYLCEHRSLGRRVAIKVLPPDKASDPLTVERFYREGRAVAALNHPNIVRAFDIDHDGNLHFLVMEFVDGVTLDKVLEKNGPMPVAKAADCIQQAAMGLQHVHEAGLVHRDIKPGNLLRDRNGTVKLLDLGLARFFANVEQDNLTRNFDDKSILGTADYIAPEQGMNSHDVDIRADIYSLGATLYHLLGGQPPFAGGTVTQKLIMHQMREPTAIRQLRPEVPPGLANVVARMLCKDPARRYQTPAEVAEALGPFASDVSSDILRSVDLGANGPEPEFIAEPPKDQSAIFEWANMLKDEAVYKPDEDPTLPPLVSPSGRKLHGGPAAKTRDRRLVYAAAIAAGLLAIGGVGTWWIFSPAKHVSAGVDPGEPPARTGVSTAASTARPNGGHGVTLHHPASSPGREFSSLQETMLQAKAGDKIVLHGDLAEAVTLEGSLGRDVTIEAAAGHVIHWRPPPHHKEGQPLLQISNVTGVRVKGIEFDGQNHVLDLIVVTGRCAGTTLDGLTLVNFKQSAVALRHCVGDYNKPLTLHKLRVLQAPGGQAGVLFTTAAKSSSAGHQHIVIRDSRFEGPFRAAIEFAESVGNIEVAHNRFYQATNGLLYRKAEPLNALHLLLNGNTFYATKTAVAFEALPPSDSGSWILAQNNLFVKTSRVTGVEGFTGEPADMDAKWVWTKEADGFKNAPTGSCCLRRTFTIAGPSVARALVSAVADDSFRLWVNGEFVGQGQIGAGRAYAFDVAKFLRAGENVLAVQATNNSGPAGLLVNLCYWPAKESKPIVVGTDSAWKVTQQPSGGWQRYGFDDAKWEPAKELGYYKDGPWHFLWDAEIARWFPDQGTRMVQLADQIAVLQKTLDDGTPELAGAQSQWESEWRAKLLAEKSTWTPVRPETAVSSGGATMTIENDQSVVVSGTNPPQDTFTLTMPTDKQHITAIALETLTHPSLGNQSLSRGNGNFVLTRFEVEVAGKDKPAPVKLAAALADYSQNGFAIANVINPSIITGWAVDGSTKRVNRNAMFVFAQPLAGGPGTVLTIRLKHDSPHVQHVIGHFRVSLTTTDKPSLPESNTLPADVYVALLIEPDKRSPAQQARLTKQFQCTSPLLEAQRRQLADLQREQEQLWSPFRGPAGNFRDKESRDAYPFLKPPETDVALPTDSKSDAQFLRYSSQHALRQAGPNKSPVGVPPE